jgi:hypothetical protein
MVVGPATTNEGWNQFLPDSGNANTPVMVIFISP